ncbi:MAG: hypothetical protein O2960_11405 [Verrucomicrobia bacterium]|nr:hypothetical protein [Verrucomicrobiota bacterium]
MAATAILAAKGIVTLGNLDLPKNSPEQPGPMYVLRPDGTLHQR